jgi:hypothetical protein
LRINVLKMQEYRILQRDILQMKNSLLTVEIPGSNCVINLGSVDDLPKEVEYCEVGYFSHLTFNHHELVFSLICFHVTIFTIKIECAIVSQ